MTPRLTSSKKWTAFPSELIEQIQSVFMESFADAAKRGKLLPEGRIYAEELLFRVGFLEEGRLVQPNFEVSLDFNAARQNALQMIHFAVDCAATLLQEYFEGGEELDQFPRKWQEIQIDKRPVFVQISTDNTALEQEADRLLGVLGDDLVQGRDDESEEKAVITMLGLENDGEDDDGHSH